MLAKLIAVQIIDGNYTSNRVPHQLKDDVNIWLTELGRPDLVF